MTAQKELEMIKEIEFDFINNQMKKVTRCWCCEWDYFILPNSYKCLNQNINNICEDCKERTKTGHK